ncbi:hypothetical protein F2Q70_00021434 [Brassica cretica]|uniref:Uncharacterized protein n=2 Tax=Brassica cretica TaxID=69181 RepID=A0A8S9GFN7_BRACR|nr:hypothetical protein F2Q70_00021434 [Brassica cretica]KAF2556448.1 hypothetical protein F2Q68_00014983 [Brassica cretica]KAF3605626.1 hypothetical protein DY000_02047727 [Brassica cretica]
MSTPWSYWWTQDFGSVATEMDLREPDLVFLLCRVVRLGVCGLARSVSSGGAPSLLSGQVGLRGWFSLGACGVAKVAVWHSMFRSVSLVFTSALCRCFSGEALWTYHRFSVLARGGFLGSPWGLRCSGFPLELRVKIRLPSIIVGSLEPP